MTFNHLNRRVHLYLALALLPWFFVYGISSLAIQHGNLFTFGDQKNPPWESIGEKPYSLDIPKNPDWRQIGARVLMDMGDDGLFRVNSRDPAKIQVTRFSFWSQSRYTYNFQEKQLAIEHQGLNLRSFIVWLHIRSGFNQESFLSDLWAVIVDIVNVGFVLWAASGVYMWWLLPAQRKWGVLALGAGVGSFAWFLTAL
jgi:hypothetical protein